MKIPHLFMAAVLLISSLPVCSQTKLSELVHFNILEEGGRYGLTHCGEKVVYPQYDSLIYDFRTIRCGDPSDRLYDILFLAKLDGKWGVVDRMNRIVCPFIFSEIKQVLPPFVVARIEERYGVYDACGNLLVDFRNRTFDASCGSYCFSVRLPGGKKYGAIDIGGNEIVKPGKSSAADAQNLGDKLVRRSGLLSAEFERQKHRADSLLRIRLAANHPVEITRDNASGRLGMRDGFGRELVPPGEFDYLGEFEQDTAIYVKAGYIGKVLLSGFLVTSEPIDLMQEGLQAYKATRYDEAIAAMEHLIVYEPENYFAYMIMAHSYFLLQNYDRAIELYDFIETHNAKRQALWYMTSAHDFSSSMRENKRQAMAAAGYAGASSSGGWLSGLLDATTNMCQTLQIIRYGVSSPSETVSGHTPSEAPRRSEGSNSASSDLDRNARWMTSSYRASDTAYSNYESQLVRMKANPESYNERMKREIQGKMRNLREQIVSHGGTRSQSPMETW